MSSQGAYGYAVARIRAMEHRLLDQGVLQRMIDAEDFASILKILGETSYSSALASQTGGSDFDKVLESDLHSIYEEVRTFVPDKKLVDIMRLHYDFHNVKVLLKSMFNVRTGGKKMGPSHISRFPAAGRHHSQHRDRGVQAPSVRPQHLIPRALPYGNRAGMFSSRAADRQKDVRSDARNGT